MLGRFFHDFMSSDNFQNQPFLTILTLKAPITTAADDKVCEIFANFRKKLGMIYFMRIVCQQTILLKYHALFVIFEKAEKFKIVVCCEL